jgi:hypothetical protein
MLWSSISSLMSALTTHTSNQFREKIKKKRNNWKPQTSDQKQTNAKTRSLEWEKSRPLRQGQWLNTTEVKCSKIADSSRWGKRARHHQQNSKIKIQVQKSTQMHECKIPLNKCISPNFLSPWCKAPPGNMNCVLSSPLLVMHESILQILECDSIIYKEHYNKLKLRHRQAR